MKIYGLSALILTLTLCGCQGSEEEKENNSKHLFQKISPQNSGVTFINELSEDPDHSIINYIYYYNGGGVATGDINNDGLSDLFFVSNLGENKLYLNKGDLRFEDISNQAMIKGNSSWNTGVTMVDINQDGLLDIYVCAVSGLLDFQGHNELFINNGDLTFTESAAEYGLDFRGYSTQAYFFDYDKDLDLDVYIVNHAVHTTLSHGNASVRNDRVSLTGDVLLQNNNGKFQDVSEQAKIYGGLNGYGLSATLADFNNDGWDDIYVCNDFHEDDYYYINNQDGTFSEDLGSAFSTISRFSMGSDSGDLNADGYPDLITLDMLPKDERVIKESEGDNMMLNMQDKLSKLGYKDQYARNMLQMNNQGQYFNEVAILNNVEATDWSWSPLIADFNNDGAQDLFISNGILRRPNNLDFKNYVSNAFKNRTEKEGMQWLYRSREQMPPGDVPNEIFQGNNQKLANRTGQWIEDEASFSNGAIYTDLDNDGDLDLVINNLNQEASIYENTTEPNSWVKLRFAYKGGNKEGIGTKAIIYSADKKQFKQLFKSRGFLSSVDNDLHFASVNKIDSIKIIWPDNATQIISNFKNNQELLVEYHHNALSELKPKALLPSKFSNINAINYQHIEDSYNDFYNEKLIPYKVSTLGPAVAVGDIDGNGFDDLFLGNSSGKPAKFFMNNGRSLNEKEFKTVLNDSLFEDNTATFFDADNDGDLDLYIGSGIHSNRIPEYEVDRLYINNDGNFLSSSGRIPENFLITSSVSSIDFDLDGDMDLFIGNKAKAGNFGKAVASYILENDGKGYFSKSDKFKLNSHVTSVKWEDLNNDEFPDLIITSEWDTPKIYLNKNGRFKMLETPPKLSGLWQTAAVFDIDNDGDQDILLGNWGLNTRFNFDTMGNLRMYHSDFNDDGIFETIIAQKKNGSYYPIQSRDELNSQLSYIKSVFPNYENFALKSVNQISSKKAIESANIYEVDQLASGYLENSDGKFSTFKAFPDEFQVAPITNFEDMEFDGSRQLLVSGNVLEVNTYHGGYTSFKGMLMKDLDHYKPVSDLGIEPFHEQIKKTKTIKLKESQILVVIPNSGKIKMYQY